jgi:plasmid maintenance system antidote protein VapI
MSALLDLVRAELDDAGWWQKDLAAAVGCTEKHMSQLLNGHVAMSEEWAVKILAALGRQLVVASVPIKGPDP